MGDSPLGNRPQWWRGYVELVPRRQVFPRGLIAKSPLRVSISSSRGEEDWTQPSRSGPRIVDSVLSEISTGFQAAVFTATCSKYTASGVRRSSAV